MISATHTGMANSKTIELKNDLIWEWKLNSLADGMFELFYGTKNYVFKINKNSRELEKLGPIIIQDKSHVFN